VAVSTSGSGNRIMTSADGISWTLRSTPVSTGWRSICWSAQRRPFAKGTAYRQQPERIQAGMAGNGELVEIGEESLRQV